jgi:hypothetical protein
MVSLHTLILVSVVVFATAVVAGLTAVGVQALTLWRTFRALRKRLDAGISETSGRISRMEEQLAAAAAHAGELEHARVRLQESLTFALVLVRALSGAWSLVGRARDIVPSK